MERKKKKKKLFIYSLLCISIVAISPKLGLQYSVQAAAAAGENKVLS